MGTREILFVVLSIISVSFTLLSLWRLYSYIRRYKFAESEYTLLFGFVHLHWFAVAYPIVILLWIGASYLMLIS